MEQVNLEAFVRDRAGKGPARALRRAGNIPGIFYGPGTDPVAIYIAQKALEKVLKNQASENVLYQLIIKEDGKEQLKTAMLKELQRDPLGRNYLHADFYEVSLTKEIDITVAIKISGKSPGVEKGGILQEITRELAVRCLPTRIPDFIEVDVTPLEIGDSLHVRDLKPPEGVRILSEDQLTVLTIVAPVEEKAAESEAPAAAEVEVVKKGKTKTEEEG
jgi:large subunit ribosomal protein L25